MLHRTPTDRPTVRSVLLCTALVAGACERHVAPPTASPDGNRGVEPLALEVDPLTLDFPATLTATGAAPGDTVIFVRGSGIGAGPCPAALAGLCLDVTGPVRLGRETADVHGVARLTLSLPGSVGARDVALQAVIADGADSRTSAAVLAPTVVCTHVPAQHATLQGAIDASSDGDHVCAAAGTYAERIDFGGRSLVVLGEDAASTVIDGGGPSVTDLAPVVDVSGTDASSRLSRFTVTGGHTDRGAGIRAEASDALLSDLVVTENTCDVPFPSSPPDCRGTGIYAWAGHIRLRDVAVTGNRCEITTSYTTSCEGTGLYAELGAPSLQRVEVSGNVQSGSWSFAGAGVALLDADATLEAVEVWDNTQSATTGGSTLEGGGVWTRDGTVFLDAVEIRDNVQTCEAGSCLASGTGLWAEGGTLTLDGVASVGNAATSDSVLGAGLYAWAATVGASDVEISRNAADGNDTLKGAGVYLANYASLDADHATIAANTAFHGGGTGSAGEALQGIGLYADTTATATLTNAVIADNRADGVTWAPVCSGAGVWSDAVVVLRNAIVAGNTCDHQDGRASGGGVYLDLYDGALVLENVDIVGNTASGGLGEGVYASEGTELDVVNSSLGDPLHLANWTGSPLQARYSNFWGSVSGGNNPAGADGNIAVDPGYSDLSAPDALDWDLRLDPSSVLVDAGDPVLSDADGSRSDIGAHGGPGADLPL